MGAESGKRVILAVDDVSMNLAIIKSVLSGEYDVRLAKSGELALFILGSVKVDLILLDIEMPGMSGFEFIDIVREIPEAAGIPIIFVTSHGKLNMISKALMAGAKDYVVKPINAAALKEKISRVLSLADTE